MIPGKRPEETVVRQSRLNPEAREFVPGASFANLVAATGSNVNSNNGAIDMNGANLTCSDAFLNGAWNCTVPSGSGNFTEKSSIDDYSEPDDYVALCELKEFIDHTTFNPASYEERLGFITDFLNNGCEEDPDVILECTVNSIVDQAIMETNFRYNGVRFCVHLISNFKVESTKGTFKDILLRRCQREHSRRETLARAQTPNYLRGFALFIADLSTRVDEPDLMGALPELLETLLSRTTTDNVKCACNILKLCGSQIDEYLAKKGSQQMETIIDRLKSVHRSRDASQNLKDLINNVVELRGNGWKAVPRPPTNLVNPYANGPIYNEYEVHQPAEYSMAYNQESYYCYPPEPSIPSYDFGPCEDAYDDDVCNAFEDFLRKSGQL